MFKNKYYSGYFLDHGKVILMRAIKRVVKFFLYDRSKSHWERFIIKRKRKLFSLKLILSEFYIAFILSYRNLREFILEQHFVVGYLFVRITSKLYEYLYFTFMYSFPYYIKYTELGSYAYPLPKETFPENYYRLNFEYSIIMLKPYLEETPFDFNKYDFYHICLNILIFVYLYIKLTSFGTQSYMIANRETYYVGTCYPSSFDPIGGRNYLNYMYHWWTKKLLIYPHFTYMYDEPSINRLQEWNNEFILMVEEKKHYWLVYKLMDDQEREPTIHEVLSKDEKKKYHEEKALARRQKKIEKEKKIEARKWKNQEPLKTFLLKTKTEREFIDFYFWNPFIRTPFNFIKETIVDLLKQIIIVLGFLTKVTLWLLYWTYIITRAFLRWFKSVMEAKF